MHTNVLKPFCMNVDSGARGCWHSCTDSVRLHTKAQLSSRWRFLTWSEMKNICRDRKRSANDRGVFLCVFRAHECEVLLLWVWAHYTCDNTGYWRSCGSWEGSRIAAALAHFCRVDVKAFRERGADPRSAALMLACRSRGAASASLLTPGGDRE